MISNIKTKKRLTQIIIAFVVICMSVTGSFLLLEDSIGEVRAEERTVTTEGQWNAVIDEINKAGGSWTITLGDSLSVASGKLAAIPAGATVVLNMNGKNITWENKGSGNNNIMSTSYPFADTYWGVITNKGTLRIEGTGTISSFNTRLGYKNGDGRDNYGIKHAAIVNTGALVVGGNITIKSYTAMAHEDGSSYQDMFVYTHGIYNVGGTLETKGTIKAGSLAMGVSAGSTGSNSYAVAYSYGIYGGTVNVTGGNIYSEAKSGFSEHVAIPKQANETHNFAFGIFANNPVILGETNITTKATSWRDNDSNYNTWKNGSNMSWGIGVMYYGSNYPVIGPAVSINSSYQLIASKSSFSFPEYDTALGSWTRSSSNGPESYGRHAYAVAKSPVDVTTAAMYGGQTKEELPKDAMGISVGTAPGAGEYRSEYAMHNNLSTRAASSDNKSASGSNDNGTQTSNLKNGAPGTAGSQYALVYRYYKGDNLSTGNIYKTSFAYDPAVVGDNNRVILKVSGTDNDTGVVGANSNKIAYSKGGAPLYPAYYEFVQKSYEIVAPSAYVGRDINNVGDWKGGGLLPDDGTAIDSGKMIIVYMDYVLKNPTSVRVAVAPKNGTINQYSPNASENVTITVPYTGAKVVPGDDFLVGIIDMGLDTSLDTNDDTDDKVVTSVYDISGNGSGSGNDATAVTYRYTSDNTNWTAGLPTAVGKYTVEVNVNADMTVKAGSYNRSGRQQKFKLEITPAEVTIKGDSAKTVTYGKSYAELINFNDYSAVNKNNEPVNGSWSIAGVTPTATPGAGTHKVTLVWTPAVAGNYAETQYEITLNVTKRPVTVVAGTATVVYGDANPSFNVVYSPADLGGDADKAAGWLASTEFQVKHNGEWKAYFQGMPAGTYPVRISKFGGAEDANNAFTVQQTENVYLTVEKRAIKYTASAESRDYDGTSVVDVTLSNPTNNYTADSFYPVLYDVKGEVDPNAGTAKLVTVNTENVEIDHKNNYYLVIENADNLKVDIRQATPTGVSVEAADEDVVYDKTKTLGNSVALNVTSDNIAGEWTWETPDTVPSVNVSSYTAKFTPADKNYKTITQQVSLYVRKAVVDVYVDNQEVIYGASVPALAVKYSGFTGGDDIDKIVKEGNVVVSTDYTPGSGVNKTYTISVTSDITSENYEFVAKNGTITVKPRNLTITANNDSITYGAEKPVYGTENVTVAGLYGNDTLSSLKISLDVATDYRPGSVTGAAGDYAINVNVLQGNDNYNIVPVAGVLTVKKATLTVTPVMKTVSYGTDTPSYTTADSDYKISGFVNGDSLSKITIEGAAPEFRTQYTSESFADTSYTVNVDASKMVSANYTFTGVAGTIRVVKATPKVTTAPTASVVNSHTLADAKFGNNAVVVNPNDSTKTVAGTFAFVKTTEKPSWGSYNAYQAVFTPDDDQNYSTCTVDVYVEVTVKAISGTPVIQGSAMVGSKLKVNLDSMDPSTYSSYTFQWYYEGGSAIAGATGSEYTVTAADLNKSIYVAVTAVTANGFSGAINSAPTAAVLEALDPTTAAMFTSVFPGVFNEESGAYEIEYDANAQVVTVEKAAAYSTEIFGKITVKYNGQAEKPVNAGTYIVTIDVGVPSSVTGTDYEDGYVYHAPVSGLQVGVLKITPAPLYVNVNANDKVYDGTVTATATVPQPSGLKDELDEVYLNDGIRFAFADKNAGENIAIIVSNVSTSGEDAGNYQVVVNPVTASITPKPIQVEAFGTDKDYDGSPVVGVTFRINESLYAPGDSAATLSIADSYGEAVDANAGYGIKVNVDTINVEKVGSSAKNYTVTVKDNVTVDINKARPTFAPVVISQINGSAIVYDSRRNLGSINPDNYHSDAGTWTFADESIVPQAGSKTYAATYTPDSSNYYAVDSEITVIVIKKEVTVTVDSKSVVYGSNTPAYTVTAAGFCPGDSMADVGGSYKISCDYYPGSGVASYPITIDTRNLVSENYSFVGIPGYLTVSPRTITSVATAESKVYNGNKDVKVTFSEPQGVFAGDDIFLSSTYVTGTAGTANAGTTVVYYIKPELDGLSKGNYNLVVTPASGELTVKIEKADISGVKFPSGATVEYGFDLSYVKFENAGIGDGTFAYENAKLIVADELKVYDTYKVIFTPTDSVNYNTQEAVVSLQVIKCTLNYVVGVAGNAQVGQTLTAVTTGMPAKAADFVTYQWYRVKDNNAVAINGATGRSYVATDADVGYKLIVITAFDETDPYVFAEDANVESLDNLTGIIGASTDAIKEVSLSFWQRLMNWLYRILAVLTGVQLNGGLGIGG